jgi:hypothetical protein
MMHRWLREVTTRIEVQGKSHRDAPSVTGPYILVGQPMGKRHETLCRVRLAQDLTRTGVPLGFVAIALDRLPCSLHQD